MTFNPRAWSLILVDWMVTGESRRAVSTWLCWPYTGLINEKNIIDMLNTIMKWLFFKCKTISPIVKIPYGNNYEKISGNQFIHYFSPESFEWCYVKAGLLTYPDLKVTFPSASWRTVAKNNLRRYPGFSGIRNYSSGHYIGFSPISLLGVIFRVKINTPITAANI